MKTTLLPIGAILKRKNADSGIRLLVTDIGIDCYRCEAGFFINGKFEGDGSYVTLGYHWDKNYERVRTALPGESEQQETSK